MTLLTGDILDAGFALAVQMLRDRHDAADAVQDSAHRLLRKSATFDSRRGSVRSWFLGIVRNGCLDRIRSARRGRTNSMENYEPVDELARRPDVSAAERELHARVRQELQQLSDEHREIILLRDWHDLSYAEIAGILQIPHGTVMSRLSRAREELRQRMQRYR